jgi:hypothetical protein
MDGPWDDFGRRRALRTRRFAEQEKYVPMSAGSEFRIEHLAAARHRRPEFRCESQRLTDYLRQQASQEMSAKASVCFVLVSISDPVRIAGSYTLSATSISFLCGRNHNLNVCLQGIHCEAQAFLLCLLGCLR